MQRSRGFKSKSRRKLTKVQREGRTNPITKRLQKFEEGDLVHIIIDPSIQKGQPHPRFHGKTGTVVGQKVEKVEIKKTNKVIKEQITKTEETTGCRS